ncbi:uncharacterized protein LOC110038352 isoform X2 [Phalaenopsis equestris]|uniref:uncharacterized protein LOC110038352 isoform X2 n=1 Tax=Phalaenopsis equestris TaxID=78828 RepID=UPI0009E37605|nr:uncharacterized protein LOC110038352 isoform X2 [Phalaenopsis equestris]
MVFPFGSVPLKTYLPDGDIDLTTVGFPNVDDALAADVRSVLEHEERNKDAEFEVKDVQFIHAEVKLVKCLVQNIVVDISFNQIGGLCTLCFLEQVDRLIGKDHLFKRSIILIKAWCYYESRILGAHHGLISTYALETLVLYIFHLFHSSLHGPLAVLYKFLDYYSKFDWDNFFVSLNGPVSISSLPELPAETLETDGGNLLLTKEFFRSCVDNFSVAPKGSDSRIFIKKHLNIVDPLRESNNLGRSVSKGNFYRIRSAFTYGASKLGQLLVLPAESIADEVVMFFQNTIDRHGSGERPDVQDLIPRCLDSASDLVNGGLSPSTEKLEKQYAEKLSSESLTTETLLDLSKGIKNIRVSGLDSNDDRMPLQNQSSYKQKNGTNLESGDVDLNDASFVRLSDDAKDHDSATASDLRNTTENCSTSVSTSEAEFSSFGKAHRHVPHSFYVPENGNGKDLNSETINSVNLGSLHAISFNGAMVSPEETSSSVQLDSFETDSPSSCTSSFSNHGSGCPSESSQFADHMPSGNEWNDTNGSYNVPNKVTDLTGDYDIHFRSLSYARWCQEQITGTSFLPPMHLSTTYTYHQCRDSWSHGGMYTSMNANGVTPRPPFSPTAYYPRNLPFFLGTYGTEDVPKPRGTGTYFPNMNHRVYKERHYPGRGKNPMASNQFPRSRINGRTDISHHKEKGPHEPATQALPMFGGSGRGRPPVLDMPHSAFRPAMKGSPRANRINLQADYGRLEFGSLGPVSLETPPLENGNSLSQGSGFSNTASIDQRSTIYSNNRERSLTPYQLKDEADFPPLSR